LRWWAVGASFLVLLIVTGVAVKVRKKFPMFVFGWLWFLGLLVPVIGIVKVGDQSIADRYTYFPSLGLTLIVVWGASRLQQRWARMVALLIAVGALALFTAGTVRQISYWKTSRALFEHAVAVEPMNSVAHLGLGAEDYNDGVLKSAGEHFQAALQVVPQSADAHYNMAMVLARQGRIDEAIEHYQTTLKLRPAYASAAYNCGLLLREAGRTEEAMAQFRYAVTVDPKHARARAALEEASLSQANPRKLAQSEFSAAVALMQRGQTAEALPHFREALQQQPDWPLPMNEIAWVLATDADEKVRNGPEALKLAQRACELTKFQQAEFVGTLDAAFAECANFHEAIATAEKARQLFAARGESNLAAMAEQRIALYRGGKPFRR
jgi:tetratricopeptide (TPR) repeat protein